MGKIPINLDDRDEIVNTRLEDKWEEISSYSDKTDDEKFELWKMYVDVLYSNEIIEFEHKKELLSDKYRFG